MRRSLAPSQIHKFIAKPDSSKGKEPTAVEDERDTTIARMPLFDFLEIPKDLFRQFVIPAGCVVTEK